MTFWLIGLLVGLPLSVWLLATLCAVIDEPQPTGALVRLTIAVCGVLALLLLTDRAYIYPLATSFIIVTALHIAAFIATVKVGTGIPIYEQTPPDPPLLDDDLKEDPA